MFRYVSAGALPRALAYPNRVRTGTMNTVIYVDSDDSSDYSTSDSDSDTDSDSSDDEVDVVHDYCTKRGTYVAWSGEEWARAGGCGCKGHKKKGKKKCSLVEWLCGGKKKERKEKRKLREKKAKKMKKREKRRHEGCGKRRKVCSGYEYEILCHGYHGREGPGSCQEEHRCCWCRGRRHGHRHRADESGEDSEGEGGRAVYRRRHERRRPRSRESDFGGEEDGVRVKVPVDVDLRDLRRPMSARVIVDRDDERGYARGRGGMEAEGAYWDPPILGA